MNSRTSADAHPPPLHTDVMPLHTFPSLLSTPESQGFNHIFHQGFNSIKQHCCLLLGLTPNNVTVTGINKVTELTRGN